MKKEEEVEEILTEGRKMKVVLGNPADKLAEKKKTDKLNAMRISLTFIEGQNIDATPEKAIEIADVFLGWLIKDEVESKKNGQT